MLKMRFTQTNVCEVPNLMYTCLPICSWSAYAFVLLSGMKEIYHYKFIFFGQFIQIYVLNSTVHLFGIFD